jgi:microcystin-dependent protein
MPRNSSGVYVQPPSDVNPPVSNTVIDPIAFAAAITDLGNELTNSLDRLGRAPMLAVLQMAGFKISNIGAPVAQNDVARLADVGTFLNAGAIQDFAMNTAPSGWLVCDGTAYSRTTYAPLFTAIGTTWGVGDGSTTFNVPDFRGTVRRTWDNGKGLDPGRAFASYQADGFASHTHVQPAHTHTLTDPGHTHTTTAGNFSQSLGPGAATAPGYSPGAPSSSAMTGITVVAATATNNNAGGAETVGKNYAVLTCIKT